MSKLVVTLAMVLSLTSVACGGSEVVQGKVDHNGVTGVAEGKGSTILRNVPAYDQDAVDDRPSIRVKDQDFQGFFYLQGMSTPSSPSRWRRSCARKYSDISYIVHVDGDQGTQSCFVSREVFNRILVDRPVRFEASGAPIPTITKLLEPGELWGLTWL